MHIISFGPCNAAKWTENSTKGDPAECTGVSSLRDKGCQERHRPCSLQARVWEGLANTPFPPHCEGVPLRTTPSPKQHGQSF